MKILPLSHRPNFIRYLGVSFLFLALTLIYCYPILQKLHYLGRADWDYYFFQHESNRIAMLEFKQFPLWNPYYCGGITAIGNPHSQIFSPTTIFSMIFGVIVGLRLAILPYLFLSMLGMYLLCRHYNLKGLVAFIPSVIFAMNGALMLHLASGHLGWLTSAYIPFVFLFFLKGLKKIAYIFVSALFLSLMLYGGGTYILAFTLLFLAIFSLLHSIQSKTLRPIIALSICVFLFALFSGPALLPVFELMNRTPRLTSPGKWPIHYRYFYSIFIDAKQYNNHPEIPLTPATGWWEIGSYIGILPVILFLLSFKLIKERWPLILISVLFFSIGAGNFGKFSPWTLLHNLPVFNNLHIPSRIYICFVFVLSLLVGLCLGYLNKKLANKKHLKDALFSIIFVFITFNLISTNSHMFHRAFSPLQLSENAKFKQHEFLQLHLPKVFNRVCGSATCMHLQVLKNRGIVNGYEPALKQGERSAIPLGGINYRGEFFLLNSGGKVSQSDWSPNKITFNYDIKAPDTLIVNQNYDKNWKATTLNPVKSYNGVLSIDLDPDDNEVIIYYFPSSFVFGILACLVGILLFVLRKICKIEWAETILPKVSAHTVTT